MTSLFNCSFPLSILAKLRNFFHSGAEIWNDIPVHTRNSSTVSTRKEIMDPRKTYIFIYPL